MDKKEKWNIHMSEFASKTLNPIRILWEQNQPKANPNKSAIYLQPGDPTLSGKRGKKKKISNMYRKL